ncbi:MAG: ABC transporter permease [Moraxella sp.]
MINSDIEEKTSYAKEIFEFFKSLKIQLRVVHALLMREIITRYGRHNIGFAWLFVEPMMFTLGIVILWYNLKGAHDGSLNIIPFAVTGYSTVLMWRNSAGRTVHAIEANMGLLYHRNVKIVDVFLARMLLEIASATLSFLFLSLSLITLGLMDLPNDFLLIFFGWCLLAWFSLALGLLVGSLAELSELVDRFWHTITYLLFPLSGAAFMVEWLPELLQKFVLYMPMVHSVEMIRHGYYGNLVVTHENIPYFIWSNLILSFIGLSALRYIGSKVEGNS